MSLYRRSAGLSLIELMIAMVIGLVLLLGIIQIFSASRTAAQLSEGASRVQENGRFALDYLARDIRMAGHFGCVNDQAQFVRAQGDPRVNLSAATGSGSPLDFSVSIQGYEAPGTAPGDALTIGASAGAISGLPAAIQNLSPAPRAGSDIIVLRFLSAEGVPATGIAAAGSNTTLTMDASRWARLTDDGVAAPTLFGIADCAHADVFAGTTTAGTVVASGVNLSGRYVVQPTGQTMVYRAESLVYYVANNPDTGEPALRRARAGSNGQYTSEELVEGIESLQFLYGLDSTETISTQTPPAGNITAQRVASGVAVATDAVASNQWRRVGQVQVGVLARSPTAASAAAPVQNSRQGVIGVTVVPPSVSDGRYRASYELSVALRNRLFGN
ncbi:PilW family protein [Xanthomonas nasturtii]|uniref:PilW family protein n=1 Tax=Xanthomonas TaxID=338 RepID=UPI000E1E342B|nr:MULTISPECIES: PilW family protein [Xanthomonas]MEA9554996.1 PilW family protein [Xanthomonas nasturtii]MEA9564874.1 PilW family protein [Xanthomonas sp. WHRI 8932A]MEA9635130.1 PilW family protein [Xanthomonas sp. WHRI 8812E]